MCVHAHTSTYAALCARGAHWGRGGCLPGAWWYVRIQQGHVRHEFRRRLAEGLSGGRPRRHQVRPLPAEHVDALVEDGPR